MYNAHLTTKPVHDLLALAYRTAVVKAHFSKASGVPTVSSVNMYHADPAGCAGMKTALGYVS